MQQEFYIGQKVKTSEDAIATGCSSMEVVIVKRSSWRNEPAWTVVLPDGTEGLFLPEELEPIEDSSVSEIVFDNIVKSL